MSSTPLSYKDAGVDIVAGDALVERIKPLAKKTMREGVLAGIGGFGALFEVPKRYKEPVLVSGTDGVGTKLKLAFEWNMHDTVGIDLVAMSVNDVLVQGAEPLFFLDYFACGKLDVDTAAAVVGGIANGCEMSGCALIGGETAEMPGMYPAGEYDLAGFAVGAVEKSKILTGQNVQAGDVVLGLASAGVHSNGFSLVRKIVEQSGLGRPRRRTRDRPHHTRLRRRDHRPRRAALCGVVRAGPPLAVRHRDRGRRRRCHQATAHHPQGPAAARRRRRGPAPGLPRPVARRPRRRPADPPRRHGRPRRAGRASADGALGWRAAAGRPRTGARELAATAARR